MLNHMCETLLFGRECRERLLPLEDSAGEPMRSIGVQIAGVSHFTQGYRVGRIRPPYHVVLVTTFGEFQLLSQEGDRQIGSGTITILPRGSTYQYSPSSGVWSVAWFHLANRPRWRGLCSMVTMETHDASTLASLASIYMDELSAGRPKVAMHVAEALARALEDILAARPGGDAEAIERLRVVMRTVEDNLAHKWTEHELAMLAHYSPQHFRRLARQYWGAAPMKAVTQARMRRATALLEYSSLRVSQIAAMVGYSDEFAFSAACRRETGMSPTSWRRGSH